MKPGYYSDWLHDILIVYPDGSMDVFMASDHYEVKQPSYYDGLKILLDRCTFLGPL